MAEKYYIKVGDYGQTITATCKDSAGVAVDLSGAAEVRFHMGLEGATAEVDAAASVVGDGTAGQVSYTFAEGDTDTAGDYRAEFEVSWATAVITFPNDSYITVKVSEEVA